MDGFGLFGMSGEEIYRNFTEATGAGDLAAASELWKELQEEHEEEARRVRALAVRMESAWRGDAAGAAQRGAIPLAVEHESSAPLLFTDHDLFGRQVGSFDDARNRVVPVPPAPDQPSGFEILFRPDALPTYERKLAEYNEAAQRNVDVMDGYEGASSYNGENLPGAYGSLQPDSAGISVATESGEDPGHPEKVGPRADDGHRPPVEGNWLPHPASSGPQTGGSDGGPSGPSPGASGGSPSQDTTSGGFVPPLSGVPSPMPGLPGVPSGGGQPQIGGLVPVGGWSGGGGMPGGPGSGGSPGGGGSGGRLGAEPGGGRPGGEPGHGPGGRGGAGPVAGGAAAEAAARGAAGVRGAAGAGLPMGVGAGRGKSAEDIERRAPDYLEEPDPEGLFGADALTAPPVIGVEKEEPA